jgi:hypothetical protein
VPYAKEVTGVAPLAPVPISTRKAPCWVAEQWATFREYDLKPWWRDLRGIAWRDDFADAWRELRGPENGSPYERVGRLIPIVSALLLLAVVAVAQILGMLAVVWKVLAWLFGQAISH